MCQRDYPGCVKLSSPFVLSTLLWCFCAVCMSLLCVHVGLYILCISVYRYIIVPSSVMDFSIKSYTFLYLFYLFFYYIIIVVYSIWFTACVNISMYSTQHVHILLNLPISLMFWELPWCYFLLPVIVELNRLCEELFNLSWIIEVTHGFHCRKYDMTKRQITVLYYYIDRTQKIIHTIYNINNL